MRALVSGESQSAVAFHNGGPWLVSLNVDPAGVRKPVNLREIFRESSDVRAVQISTIDELPQVLERDYEKSCALDLALLLLDNEVRDSKAEIAESLNELLAIQDVAEHLKNIFYASPLPEGSDMDSALSICRQVHLDTLSAWLRELVEFQPNIAHVYNAWRRLGPGFTDEEEQSSLRSFLVHSGIYKSLVTNLDVPEKLGLEQMNLLLTPEIQQFPNYRTLVSGLFQSYRRHRRMNSEIEKDSEFDSHSSVERQRRSVDREKVLKNVESQKDFIIDLWTRGDVAQAQKIIDELVDYQVTAGTGETRFAVMSLCHLAENAKILHLHETQLQLAKRSTEFRDSDARAWAHYGEALYDNGEYEDALKAYESAIQMSTNRDFNRETSNHNPAMIARQGYAETLAEVGRLEEALVHFKSLSRDYPQQPYVRHGLATILRRLRRYDEAIQEYESLNRDFPGAPTIASGYAALLKSRGYFDAALEAYRAVCIAYPDDAVPRNGYADTLKSMGRLEDALTEYQNILKDFPRDLVSIGSYADVLRLLGRVDEALEIYRDLSTNNRWDLFAQTGYLSLLKFIGRPLDALKEHTKLGQIGNHNRALRNTRADILKVLGRGNEALALYASTAKQFPYDPVASTGYASTLSTLGRYEEALEAYIRHRQKFPDDQYGKLGHAQTLKLLGRIDEAYNELEPLVRELPFDGAVNGGYCTILFLMGRYDQVLQLTREKDSFYVNDWEGYLMRGMSLFRLGRISEALHVFERGWWENPGRGGRDRFRSALAIAKIKMGGPSDAITILTDEVEDPGLRPQVAVLRAHAFGEAKQFDYVKPSLDVYHSVRPGNVIVGPWAQREQELVDEIYLRYLERQQPTKQDAWVYEQEIDLLAIAA